MPSAFTLTELLIVIGLIVLLIAIAVPTFDLLTGTRSLDSAQNQVSAYLARARSEAIGLQEVRGVFFYLEMRSNRVSIAMVRAVDQPPGFGPGIPPDTAPDVYLDLVPDAEAITLPRGVGLQVVDDATYSGGIRQDDAYIGYHNQNVIIPVASNRETHTLYGGVILFDGTGKLISRRYGFSCYLSATESTRMGDLFYRPDGDVQALLPGFQLQHPAVVAKGFYPAPQYAPKSSVGLALFDVEAYRTANPGRTDEPVDRDAQFGTGSYSPEEFNEEKWLDENALLLLVNRYNGTLVRAE